MKGDANDPRALIRESYRMDGITEGECRTIFLDWALGIPAGANTRDMVLQILDQYADQPVDHPMTITLKAALANEGTARRRGGRAARVAD